MIELENVQSKYWAAKWVSLVYLRFSKVTIELLREKVERHEPLSRFEGPLFSAKPLQDAS
jgi:hypothetical protein